jgi:hypothetical protein
MDQRRTKSNVCPSSISGRLLSGLALYVAKSLALNKEADDQRRKSKYAQSAAEYHHQPNGPATAAPHNLRGYIREISPRHKTS